MRITRKVPIDTLIDREENKLLAHQAYEFGTFKIKRSRIMANWKVKISEGDIIRIDKKFMAGTTTEAQNKVSEFVYHEMGAYYVDFRKRNSRIEIQVLNNVEACIAEGVLRINK